MFQSGGPDRAIRSRIPGISTYNFYRKDGYIYDASSVDSVYRSHAVKYIRDNLSRWPIVMLARVGRIFGVYRPVDTVMSEGWCVGCRDLHVRGQLVYAVLIVPAIMGMRVMRRNVRRLTPLLAMWGVVAVISAFTYGVIRYRLVVDIAMVVLGSIGLDHWLQRGGEKSGARQSGARGGEESGTPTRRQLLGSTSGAGCPSGK